MRALRVEQTQLKVTKTESTRKPEQLVKTAKKIGPKEIAKTLTEVELKCLCDLYNKYKDQKTEASKNLDVLRDIIVENARIEGWHEKALDDHNIEVSPTKGYVVPALDVAKYLLAKEDLTKEQKQEIFNQLFSVNLTNARKYFGENTLDELGGSWTVKDEFGTLKIKS